MTTFEPVIAGAIWLLVVFLIHEVGHVIAFKFFRKEVDIKLTLLGFEAGTYEDVLSLKPIEVMVVCYAGIAAGALALLPFNPQWIITVFYAACCVPDLLIIYSCMLHYKSKKTRFELDLAELLRFAAKDPKFIKIAQRTLKKTCKVKSAGEREKTLEELKRRISWQKAYHGGKNYWELGAQKIVRYLLRWVERELKEK